MKGVARLRVEAPCRIVDLEAEPPFALRSDRAGTVWLVGSAAGPLGGDDLRLRIDVGPGARVDVRSVAAQLVLPGPSGAPARVRVEATVAPGGYLGWCPEPTIVAAGADLHQVARIDVAASGTLRWREVVVLGRHGEAPGRVAARLQIDLAGRPLLRHELLAGGAGDGGDTGGAGGAGAEDRDAPGWDGPAGLAGARVVAAELVAGGGAGAGALVPGTCRGDAAVVLPLDGDGALALAAGPDARTVLASLDVAT